MLTTAGATAFTARTVGVKRAGDTDLEAVWAVAVSGVQARQAKIAIHGKVLFMMVGRPR